MVEITEPVLLSSASHLCIRYRDFILFAGFSHLPRGRATQAVIGLYRSNEISFGETAAVPLERKHIRPLALRGNTWVTLVNLLHNLCQRPKCLYLGSDVFTIGRNYERVGRLEVSSSILFA